MRRDHRPIWLKNLQDALNRAYVDWRIKPQLDSVGIDFRVMYPGHLQLSGPNIHIGNHVHVMALYDRPVRLSVFEGLGEIQVGHYCIINPGSRVSSADRIVIGESCMLAMNAYLSDADWHDTQHRNFAPGKTAPITLQDNVWIGESALVGKGVTIGENSIVGACSVVTKDVPANSIVAGTPAKLVGKVDPDNLTSRKAMFTMEQPYDEFELDYYSKLLGGNTLAGWLKSSIVPGPED
jgi:acetyltransferase-like isoleucine patch superfamily enzyme